MTANARLSVVLPVHAGVSPRAFEECLHSVLAQTRRPDEIVVVEDGPLTDGHREVIASAANLFGGVVVVRIEVNSGAGVANQAGLTRATGDWIAKVDADDISVPHRFETQLRALSHTDADLCGAAMLEFDDDPASPVAIRTNPATHDAIARRMRLNNPINHPTAMYRRTSALRSGGYPDLRRMQDYVLFARMLADGAVMTNLSEPLVWFRADQALHARRLGWGFAGLEWRVQCELRDLGLVGRVRSVVNFAVRMTYRMLPPRLHRWAHGNVLARAVTDGSRPPAGPAT